MADDFAAKVHVWQVETADSVVFDNNSEQTNAEIELNFLRRRALNQLAQFHPVSR